MHAGVALPRNWEDRPDAVYPVLLVDGIRIKIRDGSVTNRVVYVVMGINLDGDRDIFPTRLTSSSSFTRVRAACPFSASLALCS